MENTGELKFNEIFWIIFICLCVLLCSIYATFKGWCVITYICICIKLFIVFYFISSVKRCENNCFYSLLLWNSKSLKRLCIKECVDQRVATHNPLITLGHFVERTQYKITPDLLFKIQRHNCCLGATLYAVFHYTFMTVKMFLPTMH